MALLKSMFQTQTPSISVVETPQDSIGERRTYKEWGMKRAGQCDGHPDNLHPCLHVTYVQIRTRFDKDETEQTRRKNSIRQEIIGLEASNADIENRLATRKDNLSREENKIEKLKREIDEIRDNPNRELIGESPSKVGFWIGTLIIALLTVYLFIFYSSAAYSAFFKNFAPDDINIVNSIFDAQAINKALNNGMTELIMILTIPAVFLGLGFLIHKFGEQKGIGKYFKIAGLVITTFIFDFIIAYEIVEKIYEIKRGGSFEQMPEMTIGMAVQQINFWLIIFAGFVVYIIWGFVFDLVMQEHAKLDKVRHAIRTREAKIKDYKTECKKIKEEISSLEKQKSSNDGEIHKHQVELENPIIYFNDVKEDINNFFTGWLNYMTGAGKQEPEIVLCTSIKDKFLTGLQANFH
jgi:hypothetical protein